MKASRVYSIGMVVTAAVLIILLPQILPQMYVHRIIEVLVFALFAVSFNLLFGYAGLLPFGHAAFFGVGAYAAALIFKNYPATPLLLTLSFSVVTAFTAALVIGLFCVRLKASYFALISLSFQMFLFTVATKWRSVTYGDDGLTIKRPDLYLPGLGTISLAKIDNLYYLTLVLVALGILVCYLFLKTPLGNAVVSVRERDVRASFLGYNVFLTKYAVFLVASIAAGLSGGLFVLYEEFLATSCLSMPMGMSAAFMSVIGGATYFLGPVLGAAFYVIFQDWVSSLTQHWWILMGFVFVIIVLYAKGGLMSLLHVERIPLWLSRKGK